MPLTKLSDQQIAEVREIFSHYDKDDNGVIDVGEFSNLLDALDADMTDEEVKAGLDILDANKNGVIDFEEFIAWWADT